MLSSLIQGFQRFPDIKINIKPNKEIRKTVLDNETGEKYYIFSSNDDLSGNVVLSLTDSAFEHNGITIELIASKNEDNKLEYLNINKEIEPPEQISIPFLFNNIECPYDSYKGSLVIIKYFVRVIITKRVFGTKYAKEELFFIVNNNQIPELNANIRMEVGIENLVHLEYELFHSKYHLKDCVLGKVYFVDVKMRIKLVELQIIKKETLGTGLTQKTDLSLISKFEILDGCPEKEDIIPIRMFISAYDLTPTYKDINNLFSVKYYFKFVLIDIDDKAYFKQQEVILYKK